jgi:hypothetical protein
VVWATGIETRRTGDIRDPNAIHGEPLTPEMLTLKTLFDEGPLTGADPPLSCCANAGASRSCR